MSYLLRGFTLLFALPAIALSQGQLVAAHCTPSCSTTASCAISNRPACAPTVERITNTVHATMKNGVIHFQVTDVFRNNGQSIAEAEYIFPLPAGAAFDALELSVNGEMVSGETLDASKAKAIYEGIVRTQKDPALLEWIGNGMLRARIFPIAPGEEKTVVVRYQSIARREGDSYRIDYARGTQSLSTLGMARRVIRSTTTAHESTDTWSRFTLEYDVSASIGTPYSPTHLLRTTRKGTKNVVEATGTAGDITLLLPVRRSNDVAMSVLAHSQPNEKGFALIAITPPEESPDGTPRDVTFVVDVSGSMAGNKLVQAKAAGKALLESLREGDRFRVIDFATDVREFNDGEWAAVSTTNVARAVKYISELRASGSTNISEALLVALRSTSAAKTRLPLVVFVTDGEPTVGLRDANAIATLAAEKRGSTRVFTVGVSSGINATLIEQLAIEGRGTAHFVRDNESIEATVSLLARRLATPVITDARISSSGVTLSQLLPAGTVDVFAGQELVVLARYSGSGKAIIRLEGNSTKGPISWTTSATFKKEDASNAFVARLWAVQRIGWLTASRRQQEGNEELDNEIRTLGQKYGIPTAFTSYLVVEPGVTVPSAVAGSPRSVMHRSSGGGSNTSLVGAKSTDRQAVAMTAPPVVSQADAQFEAARMAAEQRGASSLASIKADHELTGTRVSGNKTFVLKDSVWTDVAVTANMRRVRVKPYSPLYFSFISSITEVRQYFTLGRVIVAGRAVAIEVHEDGASTMSAKAMQDVLRDWK